MKRANTLRRAYISGTGSAVPAKVLTNADLEKIVDTSDEWIRTRSGIERRHIALPSETTGTLGALAAERALSDAGVTARQIDMIVVATVLPEMPFPSTACFIQQALGATRAGAMDVSAACSGFIYGLSIADLFVGSGKLDHVLVIGTETLSKITDWSDRSTCVLFGDGAGAAVVSPTLDPHRGILATHLQSDGSKGDLLYMPGGGSRHPPTHETVDKGMHYIKMTGRELFKLAVTVMGDVAVHLLEQTGHTGSDLDLLITHQANMRIIHATAKRIGVPLDKVFINIQEYGNTSAASIPIALDEARHSDAAKPGDLVALVAFGGGLTCASALLNL